MAGKFIPFENYLRDLSANQIDEQWRIVAHLDSVQAQLESLREVQFATGEASALLPSVLDRAFKGELLIIKERQWHSNSKA